MNPTKEQIKYIDDINNHLSEILNNFYIKKNIVTKQEATEYLNSILIMLPIIEDNKFGVPHNILSKKLLRYHMNVILKYVEIPNEII